MSTTHVNHLNTGLMIASLAAAFVLPFELFLLSYAILGPLHYLTQISWMHDRSYFISNRWLALPVGLLAGVSLLSFGLFPWIHVPAIGPWNAEVVFFALCLSLVWVVAKSTRARLVGTALVIGICIAAHFINWRVRNLSSVAPQSMGAITFYDVFFTILLTTMIHVFVFTGAFILLGALKSKSRSGMVSFAVFLACAIACFAVPVDAVPALSDYTLTAYRQTSQIVSAWVMYYGSGDSLLRSMDDVFHTPLGVKVARWIAFAYTYHYLNWFSKTSVIRWHEVPRGRLVVVVVIWIVSMALYAQDYLLGLKWLLLLSMLHVFLEFPLNWLSFFGIGRELANRARPV